MDERLSQLNEYEKEQNAEKECVPPLGMFHKRHHRLKPEELKTGFGLHTFSSLELAIRKARAPKHICLCRPCGDIDEEAEGEFLEDYADAGAPGLDQQPPYMLTMAQERLKYLMGLPRAGDEEARAASREPELEFAHADDDFINGGSEAMRRAQKYLREHKIFEFFQFLIAHLLSDIPFDPINYLINLLDKCLIYRSGICDPPLLYQKPHIECLFKLMDRMESGFLEFSQYKTGMLTLGIKSYNPNPPMTHDGMVTKLFFIEECYECLKDLLNDMIRKRSRDVRKNRKLPKAPPPSKAPTLCQSTSNADIFL